MGRLFRLIMGGVLFEYLGPELDEDCVNERLASNR